MEVHKIDVDGNTYDYIVECDDAIETNEMDVEKTQDLTEIIQSIQDK